MIVHFTSEVAPYYKRGGLGDVAGVLPGYLNEGQSDIVISFFYEGRMQQVDILERKGSLHIDIQGVSYEFIYYHHREGNVDFYFLNMSDPLVFSSMEAGNTGKGSVDGERPYKSDSGLFIYLYFGKAALQLVSQLELSPEFMIFHDWQVCGCFAFPHLLKGNGSRKNRNTILLIHNYEYQGDILPDVLPLLDEEVLEELLPIFEEYGSATLLSVALKNADHVATVSRTYAAELREGGLPHPGLKFLDMVKKRIHSLPNGIDDRIWSPAYDRSSAGVMKKRAKKALFERLGLTGGVSIGDDREPLIVMLCRLTEQKGISLLMDFWNDEERALRQFGELLDTGIKLVVCGRPSGGGSGAVNRRFSLAAGRYPGRFSYLPYYDEKTAHELLAAADMILCPSLFEPCGLVHLYGMSFGAVPVVRPVGGLRDTVISYMDSPQQGTGFYIAEFRRESLIDAVGQAVQVFRDQPDEWERIAGRCMENDYSWARQRTNYFRLFDKIRKEKTPFYEPYGTYNQT